MPDAPLPADLIALQRTWEDAHKTTTDYADSVELLRRAGADAEPGTPLRPWTDEEQQQLDQHRATQKHALDALWGDPRVKAALADGTWRDLHTGLKRAVGAEGWTGAKGK